MFTSRLDAYILTYGDFCAHDDNDNDNNDMTDYFTPCTCTQGKNTDHNNQKGISGDMPSKKGGMYLCLI